MKIGVLGAGSVGGYLGARLASSGVDVTLVGRPALLEPIARRGLVAEDVDGAVREAPAARLRIASDVRALADADLVLVTTKAHDLAPALAGLAAHRSVVVGLQNGVSHPAVLEDALGRDRSRAGTVAWNVVWRDERTLRRSTSGPVVIERRGDDPTLEALVASLRGAGLAVEATSAIVPVLWTKLLLNLNNACNALSGRPLREQLGDRGWRRVLAACQREGLAAMAAAGLRPVRLGRLDPRLSSRVLPLPDALFRILASSMIRIDPAARSSMADDLARGRPTEVDALQGEIVRLGVARGVPTPVNRRVLEAVRRAEGGARGPLAPASLLGEGT